MKSTCMGLSRCAVVASWVVAGMGPAAASERPNVIFILTDDQGWADARFAGHPYVRTPNLDRLAREGTWFKQFYVASTVCSPSRTAFMTSHYPARHHIHGHIAAHGQNAARSMPDWLDPQAPTLASILKQAGYATAHVGKWHLGSGPDAPTPESYGFDFVRHTTGNRPYWEEGNADPYFRAKSTGLFVDEVIAFAKANKGRPFYANLWTLVPHAPLKPTPEQLKAYESLVPQAGDPAFGPWMSKYLAGAKDLKSQMQVFCATLADLDAQLGRLFDALDELKLSDRTVLFFSSDNGAEDYRIGNAANAGVGNTGPLRARKRSMYEGGVRTFGLVRWPGRVPAGRVDETSVVGAVDFLPTVCALAGVPLPPGLKPDGEDMSDLWLGGSRPRARPLFWEWLFNVQGREDGYMPPMLAVRDGAWKLFVNPDGGGAQLYDIVKDAGEERDVAAQHPEVVKALSGQALAWQKTLPPCAAREQAAATGLAADGPPRRAVSAAAAAKTARERTAMFKVKDTDRDGKLSLEEYLHKFPDEAEGRRRFPTFDADKDGVLTEEEFVTMGQVRARK